MFIIRKIALPKSPPGRNTPKLKKPFQIAMKMAKDHHPHTGQIATNKLITLISPTTAPIDTSLGLYSSTSLVPEILGIIKVVKSISETTIV